VARATSADTIGKVATQSCCPQSVEQQQCLLKFLCARPETNNRNA